MDHVSNLDRLPEHRELLKCAIACFRADDRVVGLVLSGSLSRGGVADFYSDIDLYIAVWDDAFCSVLADRDVVAEGVGAPLFSFVVAPMPGGSQAHIVI